MSGSRSQTNVGQGVAEALASTARSITWGLFLVQLFLAVCLPGGSLFGMDLKLMSSELFLLAFVIYVFMGGDSFSHTELLFVAIVVICLCFWSLLGVCVGLADARDTLSELRQIAAAIGVAFFSIFGIRRGLIKAERLITVIIYGTFAVSAVKTALVAASFFTRADPVSITRLLFGDEIRVDPIILGLVRLDFAADIVGAFALFALLAPSVSGVRFGRISKLIICVVVVLGSGFLTYARAIWLVYVVGIFAAMIVEKNWKIMTITLLTMLALGAWSYDLLSVIFEERFIVEAETSDIGRIEQARDLMAEIEARPFLGKGLGAHFALDSRDIKQKYSYELQWLAFLMQFGIVGMVGILTLVAISARDLLRAKHPAKPWMFLLFVLWLAESCLNPHLTTSYAGATFGLFMAMFYRMRRLSFGGVGKSAARLGAC